MRRMPAYRKRVVRGRPLAVVTLTDSDTHERRDHWLGDYDSPASHEKYVAITTAWLAAGRRLQATASGPLSVVELCDAYTRWAESYYCSAELTSVRMASLAMCELYGRTPAAEFGPAKCKLVRANMVRKGWSRRYINHQVQRIRAVFRWGIAEEKVPASVLEALRALRPLRAGESEAPERPPVTAVDPEVVKATLPHLPKPVAAMVELQLLSGARGKELRTLCRDQVQTTDGNVWTVPLAKHKKAYIGRARTLFFGRRAQKIIQPYLLRPDDAWLFPNEEGRPYTATSYALEIARGCERAFPPPEHLARERVEANGRKHTKWETITAWKDRLGAERWAELLAWRKTHRWHPHQLRHTAATLIRQEFGLEAAQLVLGHSSAVLTDAVYAERDLGKIKKVIARIG